MFIYLFFLFIFFFLLEKGNHGIEKGKKEGNRLLCASPSFSLGFAEPSRQREERKKREAERVRKPPTAKKKEMTQ